MFFLPSDGHADASEGLRRSVTANAGLRLLGWRDVPIDPDQLGAARDRRCRAFARRSSSPAATSANRPFEQALYLARKDIERRAERTGLIDQGFYVVSLSCRTLVYKGLFAAHQLPAFYLDLRDPDYESAPGGLPPALLDQHLPDLAAGPAVPSAGPQRRDQHPARQPRLDAGARSQLARASVRPVIWTEGSDSTSLDEALHLLERSRPQRAARAERADARRPGRATPGLPPAVQALLSLPRADRSSRGTARRRWRSPMDASSARRSIATGCGRAATRSPPRAWWWPAPRSGRSSSTTTASSKRAGSDRARCSALDLERHEILHDDELKRELGRREAVAARGLPRAPLTRSPAARRGQRPQTTQPLSRHCSAPSATPTKT